MKRIIFIVLCCFYTFVFLRSENTKTINLHYNLSDFSLSTNSVGEVEIDSDVLDVSFDSDTTKPALPEIIVSVLIPPTMEYVSSKINSTDTLVSSGIKVAHNTMAVTTDIFDRFPTDTPSKYDSFAFPAENVLYSGTEIMDGHKIVNFIVTPFKYVTIFQNLYLLENINIEITLNQSSNVPKSHNVMTECVKDLIYNKSEYTSIMGENSEILDSDSGEIELPLQAPGSNLDIYDYVIVTNNSLKEAFTELTKWKHIKGLRTKIITMEEIKSNSAFNAESDADKLKQCLNYYYKNHGIKYVLLGGDSRIVPVKNCFGKIEGVDGTEEFDIPTDLYYACFDGNFLWNSNNNHMIGERKDGMDLSPEIYLTRVPVSTPNETKAFIEKTINFEKNAGQPTWNNNILLAGNECSSSRTYNGRKQSDAEYKSNRIYNEFIHPYWDGGQFRLYDTYSDDASGANYDFSSINFKNQLSKGYPFVNVNTHGGVLSYLVEQYRSFASSDAYDFNNIGYTTIVTNACLTNSFDSKKYSTCLSKAFLCAPNSGVIAYLGSSRYGIGKKDFKKLGVSENYSAAFYKTLFTRHNNDGSLHFGEIAAIAKSSRIAKCKNNASERYIQYALNPIGDPEMSLRVSAPKTFKNMKIDCQRASVSIDPGEQSCTIYVTEDGSDKIRLIPHSGNKTSFRIVNGNKKLYVYISKPGFAPYVYIDDRTHYIFQGETISGDLTIDNGEIIAGENVTDSKPKGAVIFDGGNIELKTSSATFENSIEIKANTSFNLTNK